MGIGAFASTIRWMWRARLAVTRQDDGPDGRRPLVQIEIPDPVLLVCDALYLGLVPVDCAGPHLPDQHCRRDRQEQRDEHCGALILDHLQRRINDSRSKTPIVYRAARKNRRGRTANSAAARSDDGPSLSHGFPLTDKFQLCKFDPGVGNSCHWVPRTC